MDMPKKSLPERQWFLGKSVTSAGAVQGEMPQAVKRPSKARQ